MATLLLGAVGTAIGGPIGGAIGALLGSRVDGALFAPKGRQGPRLGDLRIQTSRYGEPVPKLFGTMRVAGSVIWATDLREQKERRGGGKGRPSVTTYSYSASFAVALSARPIRAVRRIWADGKLLRGEAGDWKSETGFRLHLGHEDQPVDPLIAAAEGAAGTPAYRGIAYAVFEGLQLADYGNRIPSLTFEVEADAAPVTVGAIASTLSRGAIGGGNGAAPIGFAAADESVRAVVESLAGAYGLRLATGPDRLMLIDGGGEAIALPGGELAARAGDERASRIETRRHAAGTLPERMAVAYHDPERDYQAGVQQARRGAAGRRSETIELPIALSATAARGLAEDRLAARWAERRRATLRLPWRHAAIRPGDVVTVDGLAGRWRVAGWTLERMVVELELVALGGSPTATAVATPGRPTREPDLPAGETRFHLLDLPPLGDAAQTEPTIWVAAAGTEPGWRRATLIASRDAGASWDTIGGTAAPAVIGTAMTALPPGPRELFDRVAAVDVELLHGGMELVGRDDDALIAGANLAMIGDELIQFGNAEPIGGNRWRLSRLLRGRRGTEAAIEGHAAGERFVLIEEASLAPIALPLAALGAPVRVIASGIGDAPEGVDGEVTVSGRALRPPAPVRLRAWRGADGAIEARWVRRSRTGWTWIDGREAPLGEAIERYRLRFAPSAGAARTIECSETACAYSAADQAADGSAAMTSCRVEVRQIGDLGLSEPSDAFDVIL